MINVDTGETTFEPPQEADEPPRKRQKRVEAVVTQKMIQMNQQLVQVKKEKAEAEEAVEDEQDEKQDLALFVDNLQTKIDKLKALALASGASVVELQRILGGA